VTSFTLSFTQFAVAAIVSVGAPGVPIFIVNSAPKTVAALEKINRVARKKMVMKFLDLNLITTLLFEMVSRNNDELGW
jgi:hypothetical protein